jgi:hypothetical protein
MVQRLDWPFGPFVKGAADGANPSLDLTGAAKTLGDMYARGFGRLALRKGTQLAMTLKDDQGTPANITSVVCVVPFGNGALAVGHSTVTDKFYLYRFDADLSGWYNSSDVFQGNTNAEPVGVLWSTATATAPVTIAEGLGTAYIAHQNAGATFPTKTYIIGTGIATMSEDLQGTGAADVYFRGVISFKQHLWGWGHNYGTGSENDRPELLRFGGTYFAAFSSTDSFPVGHRVRSTRERIVGACLGGEVLYVGTNFSLWPIVGDGRDSWVKSHPLDDSYGFGGIRSAVSARGWCYYWSHRGPMRVAGLTRPEPLWDPISEQVATVSDASEVVAAFDPDTDQVIFLHADGSNTNRRSVIAAFDVNRDIWLGPDGDVGIGFVCASLIEPVSVQGPAGPPSIVSTTNVTSSSALCTWTPGDRSPDSQEVLEYKKQSGSTWREGARLTPAASGNNTYTLTGLGTGTAYEWRVKSVRNGQSSAYDGPEANSQFTTTSTLAPPTNVAVACTKPGAYARLTVTWTNGGDQSPNGKTEITYEKSASPPSGPPYANTVERDFPHSSWWYEPTVDGTWYFACRHTRPGFTPSAWVPLDESVNATITSGGCD